MEGLKQRITNEPVMTMALIQAAVALVVGFGLNWTPEQIGLVLAFSAALLAFIARQQVTPTGKFDAAVNREAENIAEAIVTEQAEPLTAEERASLDRLRAERDELRLAVQRRKAGG